MTTTKNTSFSLHPDCQNSIKELERLVRHIGGDNVRSLTVFGKAVTTQFQPGQDTIRSVLVLKTMELHQLRELAKHGPQLGKAGLRAPLVMTTSYITESCDAFPLEFLEIQAANAVVFGDDCFADLPIKPEDVRLQCERDIKSMLIGLRQALLAAAGRDSLLANIETEAGENLQRTLRGLLFMKGETAHGSA
ncbi:MAG: hypothetical protein ACPGXK_06675, partial [Phycisphaerae bacterium]